MFEAYEAMAVAILCVILLLPFLTGLVATPIAFIIVTGMFAKIITVSYKTASELEDVANGTAIPEWVHDCVDERA